jgi:ribosomal protein L29
MKEFKQKTVADLKKLLGDKKEELRVFRFGSAGSRAKNVKAGRTLRKDIARIETEFSMRKAK